MDSSTDANLTQEAAPIQTADRLAEQIREEHRQAEAAIGQALEHALRCGDLLIEAKAACPAGTWSTWVTENCGFSLRTAQSYIRLAGRRADLGLDAQRAAPLSIREACRLIADPRPAEDEYDGLPAEDRVLLRELDAGLVEDRERIRQLREEADQVDSLPVMLRLHKEFEQIQNRCAERTIRCERRLGQLIHEITTGRPTSGAGGFPAGVQFLSTGLVLPPNISFEDWVKVGQFIASMPGTPPEYRQVFERLAQSVSGARVPRPGHALIGQNDTTTIMILPSTHDGYYHVGTLVHDGDPEADTTAEGTKKPIRADHIQTAIDQLVAPDIQQLLAWQEIPREPVDHNPLLFDSHEQFMAEVLGAKP
ncbi:MAG: hypothetical protein AMXMBFR13_22360 [Phycisphaerae bacterium]